MRAWPHSVAHDAGLLWDKQRDTQMLERGVQLLA